MNVSANNENVPLRDNILRLVNSITERPRLLTALLAFIAFGVAAASVFLTDWLELNPCYLCIVQRTLAILVALSLSFAVVMYRRSVTLIAFSLTLLLSFCGAIAAAFQSYEQWFPLEVSCSIGQPNILERAVDWLGTRYPNLFLATGICEEKELEIFWLSLANWSFICFSFFIVATAWLFWRQVRNSSPAKEVAE